MTLTHMVKYNPDRFLISLPEPVIGLCGVNCGERYGRTLRSYSYFDREHVPDLSLFAVCSECEVHYCNWLLEQELTQ